MEPVVLRIIQDKQLPIRRAAKADLAGTKTFMPEQGSRQFPLAKCSACGGDWFREATYYGFLREETLVMWETWPDLTGQATMAHMTVGVCLCGTPLEPTIGGVRGGRTPNAELLRFLASLKKGREWLGQIYGEGVSGTPSADSALAATFQGIQDRLERLRLVIGRRNRPGRGRRWALPERRPASGCEGLLTRDEIVWKLQEKGLEFRNARKVLRTILSAIVQGLRAGEDVDVPPLGRFFWKDQPATRTRQRWEREQTLFRQPRKVAFRPTKALKLLLNRPRFAIQRETTMPTGYAEYACEKCGSTMFTEGKFSRYRKVPSSLPGGDLDPVNKDNPIRALVCVCGHPVRPGRLRRQVPGDQTSFQRSMEAAVRYRRGPDNWKQRLEALLERMSRMEALIQAVPVAPSDGNR